jgi:ABC-type bacteriocin/lantibiotic exporter with double-glycine peptidase domain
MVLDYLRVPFRYSRLIQLLRIESHGTAFSSIQRLTQLGVNVEYEQGDLSTVVARLQDQLPLIAFVNTGMLSYWDSETGHAVVIIGIDENVIFINDPAQDKPALRVPLIEFESAWIEQDLRYAVVGLPAAGGFARAS